VIADGIIIGEELDVDATAKTLPNCIVDELKQFEELTSGTSSGSANVISTQLNSDAP